MRRSNEPLWWIPFSGGMMIDALALPALILITGILLPLGVISESIQATLLSNILVRLGLFVVIAGTFMHAAHRLKFVLMEVGLRGAKTGVTFLCYGAAIAGSIAALLVALKVL